MRTYGRIYVLDDDGNRVAPQPPGYPQWVPVTTDASGFNDAVWLTTLIQVILLNINESPFYAQFGIPDQPTIMQQVQPDYYLTRISQQFAQYFASLVLTKTGTDPPGYKISVLQNNGSKAVVVVPE